MNIDFTKIENVIVGGIDYADYPKFCDAYVEECDINEAIDRCVTEEQLDAINDNGDFVYECVVDAIYNVRVRSNTLDSRNDSDCRIILGWCWHWNILKLDNIANRAILIK